MFQKLAIGHSLKPIPLSQVETWKRSVHVFERRDLLAIDTARAAGRPLLVRGEPGTGKSQLARAVATLLGNRFVSYVVTAKTELEDLWYRYDTVRRLGEAQVLSALHGKVDLQKATRQLEPGRFVIPGPMWWAFNPKSAVDHCKEHQLAKRGFGVSKNLLQADDKRTVLLLDEIDKAESDLANALLEVLANGAFRVDVIDELIGAGDTSFCDLIVITSNDERQLPPAFVRRCVVLQLFLPEDEKNFIGFMVDRAKQHHCDEKGYCNIADEVLIEAARQLFRDREAASRGGPKPGQAEYLDMVKALVTNASTKEEQLELLKETNEYVFKKHEDLRYPSTRTQDD